MLNKVNNRYTRQKNKKVIRCVGVKGKGIKVGKRPKGYVYMSGGSCGMSFIDEDYDVKF